MEEDRREDWIRPGENGGEYRPWVVSENNGGQGQRRPEITPPLPGEKNNMALASLVLGILSLVTCCCSCLAVVLGALGIIFAFLSKEDRPMCSQAKAGLILSCVGVGLAIVTVILGVAANLMYY